jgi:hypothetical protein
MVAIAQLVPGYAFLFKKFKDFSSKLRQKLQFNYTIYTICYRPQIYCFNVQVSFLFALFLNTGNVFWVIGYV